MCQGTRGLQMLLQILCIWVFRMDFQSEQVYAVDCTEAFFLMSAMTFKNYHSNISKLVHFSKQDQYQMDSQLHCFLEVNYLQCQNMFRGL